MFDPLQEPQLINEVIECMEIFSLDGRVQVILTVDDMTFLNYTFLSQGFGNLFFLSGDSCEEHKGNHHGITALYNVGVFIMSSVIFGVMGQYPKRERKIL